MDLTVQELTDQLLKGFKSSFVCDENTDLVLEGYPRSGNTFSVDFINYLNDRKLKIAHHTHDSRNLLLAHLLEVPAVALLRAPIDAISSFMIYSGKPVEFAANRYFNFYKELLVCRDTIEFVSFADVVSNINIIVERINNRFDLDLKLSTDIDADIERVNNIARERARKNRPESEYVRTVGAPTVEREVIKNSIRPDVELFLSKNTKISDLYESLI